MRRGPLHVAHLPFDAPQRKAEIGVERRKRSQRTNEVRAIFGANGTSASYGEGSQVDDEETDITAAKAREHCCLSSHERCVGSRPKPAPPGCMSCGRTLVLSAVLPRQVPRAAWP